MKKINLLIFFILMQIMSFSLKGQKIDSLKIICRDLSGESRGVVTKEMFLKRWYDRKNTMCTMVISDMETISNFYTILKKIKKRKSNGVICNVLIILYSNGTEKETFCVDNQILYRGNGKSYDAKKIILLLNLRNICNSSCD